MKDNYDFSHSIPNPYIGKLPKKVTIQLEDNVLNYFTELAEETGISSQKLMALYLQDCVHQKRKPVMEWLSIDHP